VAALASLLGPRGTRAANGDAIRVGQSETGTLTTSLTASPSGGSTFVVSHGGGLGTAVRGVTSAATSTTNGVWGQASSSSGRGVVGLALNTTSNASGVIGVRGTLGSVNQSFGAGVVGVADAPGDDGVVGRSSASTGNGIGVVGTTASASGHGIQGSATASTGAAAGVRGVGHSVDGYGVLGVNQAVNGGVGVFGTTANTTGTGVLGAGLVGVHGRSAIVDGTGVVGESAGSATGVVGVSGPSGVPSPKAKTGVYGQSAIDVDSRGVHGYSPAGRGVFGQSATGAGGFFSSESGFALRTSGRLKFEQASGVATIPSGLASTLVTPGTDIGASTFVLLTPRGDPGSLRIWYTVSTAADTFTIHSSAATTADLKVGWLIIG
jgi:hypothetical protein